MEPSIVILVLVLIRFLNLVFEYSSDVAYERSDMQIPLPSLVAVLGLVSIVDAHGYISNVISGGKSYSQIGPVRLAVLKIVRNADSSSNGSTTQPEACLQPPGG